MEISFASIVSLFDDIIYWIVMNMERSCICINWIPQKINLHNRNPMNIQL